MGWPNYFNGGTGPRRGPLRGDGLDRVLETVAGRDAEFVFLLLPVGPVADDSLVPTGSQGWVGDEALSVTFWPGGTEPKIDGPTAEWIDPEAGRVRVIVPGSCTEGLNGRYMLRVIVADAEGGLAVPVGTDRIVFVAPSPADTAPDRGPAYCTAEDVDLVARSALGASRDRSPGRYLPEIDRASRWVDDEVAERLAKARCAGPWPPAIPDDAAVRASLADGRLRKGDSALVTATSYFAASLAVKDEKVAANYEKKARWALMAWSGAVDLDADDEHEVEVRP